MLRKRGGGTPGSKGRAPVKNLSNRKDERGISANTMKMKFMQRGEEAALRERLRVEREETFKAAQWVAMPGAQESLVKMETTSLVKDKLGRRSFGGLNKDIEKLQEEKAREARREQERWHQNKPKAEKKEADDAMELEEQADISALDMARAMGQAHSTPSPLKRKEDLPSEQPAKKARKEKETPKKSKKAESPGDEGDD